MIEQIFEKEPGTIVNVEYLDEGQTAQLDIVQIGGDILRFTVPTKPLVSNSSSENTIQTTELE